MAKLVSLLIVLALVMTNSVAIAAAKCHHINEQAHAAALQSADKQVSLTAAVEDEAKAASGKRAGLAKVAAQLVGLLIPATPVLPQTWLDAPVPAIQPQVTKLSSMAVKPLLEPPSV